MLLFSYDVECFFVVVCESMSLQILGLDLVIKAKKKMI